MSVAIVEEFTNDKACEISESWMARGMYLPVADPTTVGGSVGTNWTKLLLGAHIAFNSEAANNVAPQVFLGVCSGLTTPHYSLASPAQHAIGVKLFDGTWNYNASTPDYYDSGGVFAAKAVHDEDEVNVLDSSSGWTGSLQLRYAAEVGSATHRCGFFVQLEKSGSNVGVKFAVPAHGSWPIGDMSTLAFRQAMGVTDISSISASYSKPGGTLSRAVDQATYGYLDTFNFANTGVIPCHVYAVAFRKLS